MNEEGFLALAEVAEEVAPGLVRERYTPESGSGGERHGNSGEHPLPVQNR